MIVADVTLSSKNSDFTDGEIKRAKKKLKKAGIPKEKWYMDVQLGNEQDSLVAKFKHMVMPNKTAFVRYWIK